MFITKNRITISLVVFALIISMVFIAPVTLFIIFASMAIVLLINHVRQNYAIDYKYVMSFTTQLVGLILLVGSFVSLFIIVTNLIVF